VIEKSTVPIKTAEAIARVLSANEAAAGGSKNLDCREWMEWVTGSWIHYAGNSGRLSWWRMANGSRSAMVGKGFHLKTLTWLLFLQETYYPFSNL
jgi:hypothetical protein